MRGEIQILARSARGGLVAFAAAGAIAANASILEEANAYWAGATCSLRVPIEIKAGRDGKGWSQSPLYRAGDNLDGPLFWALLVSDREALAPAMDGKRLAAGTALEATGWRLVHPGDEGGVTLDLRARDLPVEMRFRFRRLGSFGRDSLPLARLGQAERYLRFEICDVAPREEPLPAAPRAPHAAATTPAPSPPTVTHRPSLDVLAVSVRPARASPGDTVELVAVYRLAGVPVGSFFEVLETREISLGDVSLQRLEQGFPRTADDYTSSWPVRLPASIAPGLYRLRFEASAAGLEARGEALLEVIP